MARFEGTGTTTFTGTTTSNAGPIVAAVGVALVVGGALFAWIADRNATAAAANQHAAELELRAAQLNANRPVVVDGSPLWVDALAVLGALAVGGLLLYLGYRLAAGLTTAAARPAPVPVYAEERAEVADAEVVSIERDTRPELEAAQRRHPAGGELLSLNDHTPSELAMARRRVR